MQETRHMKIYIFKNSKSIVTLNVCIIDHECPTGNNYFLYYKLCYVYNERIDCCWMYVS